jgi:cleavage and polyadenylation specificity factor subunit 3
LDCGLHPAHTGLSALPFFDFVDPASIDLVLITHFHVDHAAGLPWFTEKVLLLD